MSRLNYKVFGVLNFIAQKCTVNFKIIVYTTKIKKSIYYGFLLM
jgi:hypothetical protein